MQNLLNDLTELLSKDENLRFTEKAEEIIRKNETAIKKLSIRTDIYALEADLLEYKSLMQKYFQTPKPDEIIELQETEKTS